MKAAGGDVKLCSLKGIVAQALQLIRLDHLFWNLSRSGTGSGSPSELAMRNLQMGRHEIMSSLFDLKGRTALVTGKHERPGPSNGVLAGPVRRPSGVELCQ